MGLGGSIVCSVPANDPLHLFELLAREGEEETQTGNETLCCINQQKRRYE